jgi:hypothetical protein
MLMCSPIGCRGEPLFEVTADVSAEVKNGDAAELSIDAVGEDVVSKE